MRRTALTSRLLVAGLVAAVPAGAATPKALEPLAFLLGDWQAVGGGAPGQASGGSSFAASLQGQVIVRTNFAEYPATDKPASRHDDLMVFYATPAGEIRADYYDSEGHVIRYAAGAVSRGELTLVSEATAGAPRFRLGYRLRPDGILEGRFEIAPPGNPDSFAPYLSWTARRRPDRP